MAELLYPNKNRSRESIERLVMGTVRFHGGEMDPEAKALVDRICETGESIWHANAVLNKVPCYCAHCNGREPANS